ncbi:hypothetical protein PM082_003175 [Marasmius tenuissimus]|nr:hypothetical protein PM082_003175 [Marasmius tenuissimus]
MDPPASQLNLDNTLLSQFLSFIPTLQTLSQQTPPNNNVGLTSFLSALQPGGGVLNTVANPTSVTPATALPSSASSTSSSDSGSSTPSASPSAAFVQAQPLAMASTSGSSSGTSIEQPAPPIAPYTSVQMLNAVASASSSVPSSSNPGRSRVTTMAGFPSLSLTQQANAQRLGHAAVSLPQSNLQKKKKKPRGKAKRPPSLITQTAAPKIDDCLATAEGGVLVVNLQVNVYPPQPPASTIKDLGLPRHLHLYQRNRESFTQTLAYLNLTFRYPNLPITTSVIDLIGNIAHQLRSSGYNLPLPPSSSMFALHEQLPLQVLGYTNLGRPNTATKTVRLVTTSITSTSTLHEILANKSQYANPKLSVTTDNFFEMNLIVRSSCYPLELDSSLAEVKLGNDEERRIHRCISKRVYGLFQSDVDAQISEGVDSFDEEEMEASCDEGEDDSDTSVEEERVIAQTLSLAPHFSLASASTTAIAPTSTRASPVPAPVTPPVTPPPPSSSQDMIIPGPVTRATSTHLGEHTQFNGQAPPALWEATWVERQTPGLDTIFGFERTVRVFEIVTETYINNHGGTPAPTLKVTARDYEGLADSLRNVIVQCIRSGDFTLLLSADRHFILVDSFGRYVSSGNGIEREAVHMLCKRYLNDRAGQFFTPLIGEYSTLSTPPGISSRWMSEEQQLELSVLGTIVALALIYEMGTEPLNPLLLIYFINESDIACLTGSLVSRWFPGLHRTLLEWKSLGPEDDVSTFSGHFATYHDIQVSALSGRSAEMHTALGSEMLYAAIVGKRGPRHPVFQCFLRGFFMPCDQGYNFTELVRVFHGGSEKFVCTVYQSHIDGYHDLRLHHVSKLSPGTENRLTVALSDNPSTIALEPTFEDFFWQFLESLGYPDLDMMLADEGRFSSAVNLEDIGMPNFRMRMLCWAATGSPHILEGAPIKIILVEDDDPEYGVTLSADQLDRALKAGVCKFRTCAREMRIPVSFMLRLLTVEYSASSEIDARVVLHHWLLVSLLDNISQATLG